MVRYLSCSGLGLSAQRASQVTTSSRRRSDCGIRRVTCSPTSSSLSKPDSADSALLINAISPSTVVTSNGSGRSLRRSRTLSGEKRIALRYLTKVDPGMQNKKGTVRMHRSHQLQTSNSHSAPHPVAALRELFPSRKRLLRSTHSDRSWHLPSLQEPSGPH